MYEVTDWREQINIRVQEKRRLLNARRGASWLLMFASGLVMLTFLRVSILSLSAPLTLPALFWAAIPLGLGTVFSLAKAYTFIKESELLVAAQLVQLALVVTVFSLFILIVGISEWIADLKSLPRMASAGLLLFLSFYVINVMISLFHLRADFKKLKNYEIHSMNISSFQNTFAFAIFLVAALAVFVVALSL
jgi:hypothetical protein